MLRRQLIFVVPILCCAMSAKADTEMTPFDPVAGFAPAAIAFDESTGKDGIWLKNLPCGANRASVTVKFDKAYHSDNWAPVAKIWLNPPDAGEEKDPSNQAVAAVLQGPTDIHRIFATVWVEKVTGPDSQGHGVSPADLDAPLRVDLAWSPKGDVYVNFGGQYETHMTIGKPVTRIELAVSWSKFEFINLKVGRSGQPDPACPVVQSPPKPQKGRNTLRTSAIGNGDAGSAPVEPAGPDLK